MMHGKRRKRGAELAAEKAERNRGSGPNHPPKKVGLAKWRILERLTEREAVGKYGDIVGGLSYRERKGWSAKARKGLTFTLRAQNQI